ncbi:TetR/AcrR family transcriptional regulator [Magnetococcales bacterium HHB-1]
MLSSSRKAREFVRRENDILIAARDLFNQDHWESVTVADIAKKTEIGKGTVYKHFPSKEALYARISLDFSEQLLQSFHQQPESENPVEDLKVLINLAFEHFFSDPVGAKLSNYCDRPEMLNRLPKELSQRFLSCHDQFKAVLIKLLESGQRQGLFPETPVNSLLLGLHATFEGAQSMIRNRSYQLLDHEMTQKEFQEQICQFMLAGISGKARA